MSEAAVWEWMHSGHKSWRHLECSQSPAPPSLLASLSTPMPAPASNALCCFTGKSMGDIYSRCWGHLLPSHFLFDQRVLLKTKLLEWSLFYLFWESGGGGEELRQGLTT